MPRNKSKKNQKKKNKNKNNKQKSEIGENKGLNLKDINEDLDSDKSESFEDDEVKNLTEKFDNIWIYQTDEEENDIKQNNKVNPDDKQILDNIKPLDFNINTKFELTTHTIKDILEKIPEAIRPSIDEYLNIYYKVDDKDVILNDMFITDNKNYLEYGGRIYRKNRNPKENLNSGINYICKTHRENENKRKNKAKLCYGRIEKKKVINNFKEEIKYFFRVNHSTYCDEKYVRAINADLNEWIKKLANNNKGETIYNNNDKNKLKNIIIDYCNENCPDSLTKLKDWFRISYPKKMDILTDPNYIKNIYSRWKMNSNSFKFITVFENDKTLNGEPFVREVIYHKPISGIFIILNFSRGDQSEEKLGYFRRFRIEIELLFFKIVSWGLS